MTGTLVQNWRESDANMALEYTGVFGPIFISHYLPSSATSILVILKQFGTGVIISTSLVHVRAYLRSCVSRETTFFGSKASAR